MRITILTIGFLFLAISSWHCGQSKDNPAEQVTEGTQWLESTKRFENKLTIENVCMEGHRVAEIDPIFNIFNCSQTVTFYPDGTAELRLTDIMNLGTYEVAEDIISYTGQFGGEVSDYSWIIENPTTLLSGQSIWALVE